MARNRHSERERSDKRLRSNYIKQVTVQYLRVFHDVAIARLRFLTRIHEEIEKERRKAIRKRAEKLKKAISKRQVTVYAVYSYDSLREANIDSVLIERYGVELDELLLSLGELSRNGMSYVLPEWDNANKLKAIGRYYYAPFNQDEIHSTACAIRLTPKTADIFLNQPADFYIIAVNTPEGLTSLIVERSNPVYHLLEYLAKIMRRKSRRERHTRKRKGHYGVIQKDELLNMVYTNWFEERYTLPLWHAINCKYCLKLFNAHSVGLPERAFRLGDVNVIAILGRKGKWTKRFGRKIDKLTVYERGKAVEGVLAKYR